MYGEFQVENKHCYLANALYLVDLTLASEGDVVKLTRGDEHIFMTSCINPNNERNLIWGYITEQSSFSLYKTLGVIPSSETLNKKGIQELRKGGFI